jgi:hypothetical protein
MPSSHEATLMANFTLAYIEAQGVFGWTFISDELSAGSTAGTNMTPTATCLRVSENNKSTMLTCARIVPAL